MPDTLPNAARETRRLTRAGLLHGPTFGQADCHVRGAPIVRGARAAGFEPYRRRNAQACLMLAVFQPSDPHLPTLGAALDIRPGLLHAAA